MNFGTRETWNRLEVKSPFYLGYKHRPMTSNFDLGSSPTINQPNEIAYDNTTPPPTLSFLLERLINLLFLHHSQPPTNHHPTSGKNLAEQPKIFPIPSRPRCRLRGRKNFSIKTAFLLGSERIFLWKFSLRFEADFCQFPSTRVVFSTAKPPKIATKQKKLP